MAAMERQALVSAADAVMQVTKIVAADVYETETDQGERISLNRNEAV